MSKKGKINHDGGAFAICWWQNLSITRERDGLKRTWEFSPLGPIKLCGWVLMRYTESVKCNMGGWHGRKIWSRSIAPTDNAIAWPRIPESVSNELHKRSLGIKEIKPAPQTWD